MKVTDVGDPNLSRLTDDGCGEGRVRLGRYREVMEACRKMIEVKPNDALFHNNVCVAHSRLGHYQKPIGACSQTIRLEPGLAVAYNNLAMTLGPLGNDRKAIETYRKAIQINP